MSSFPYIVLISYDRSSNHRYKATEMSMPHKRTDTIDYTISGKVDKASGPVLHEFTYMLRVPIDTAIPDNSYGIWDDLRDLFEANNPYSGTLSDRVTLIDHFGASRDVYFKGDMTPQPLSTIIEGVNGWFMIPVSFVEKT